MSKIPQQGNYCMVTTVMHINTGILGAALVHRHLGMKHLEEKAKIKHHY
jgi:hypothetical protein